MPIMDGLAAAERIAGARIAPVIILTAFSQRDLVERARAAGAMAYLVKPFQKSDLVPAVEIALSRYSEIAALEAEVAGLTDRLETRKTVERAKGALMTTYGMTEPQAFKWIQRTAMDHRMTMKEVAERILAETAGGEVAQPTPEPTDRRLPARAHRRPGRGGATRHPTGCDRGVAASVVLGRPTARAARLAGCYGCAPGRARRPAPADGDAAPVRRRGRRWRCRRRPAPPAGCCCGTRRPARAAGSWSVAWSRRDRRHPAGGMDQRGRCRPGRLLPVRARLLLRPAARALRRWPAGTAGWPMIGAQGRRSARQPAGQHLAAAGRRRAGRGAGVVRDVRRARRR